MAILIRVNIGSIVLWSVLMLAVHGTATVALDWQDFPGYRRALFQPVPSSGPGFEKVSGDITGIHFSNTVTTTAIADNRILENGSGVALGDVNGDGWCDIYFCAIQGSNRLYINEGQWRFRDATVDSGVGLERHASTGAALVDLDGDADLDLLVNGLGEGTRLFLNDGKGVFIEQGAAGLSRTGAAHSMALADIDLDGDLDLYVTNYRTTTWQDRPPGETRRITVEGGRTVVRPADRFKVFESPRFEGAAVMELGEEDYLYLNDGKASFSKVDWMSGTFVDTNGQSLREPLRDWGLAAAFHDLNGDGLPDLYVCNDFYHSPDRIWINQGSGRFKLASSRNFRSLCESSMAVDFADVNRDGLEDLFVVDMLARDYLTRQTRWKNVFKEMAPSDWENPDFAPEFGRNMLYLNRGDFNFSEIGRLAGLDATDWTWNVAFMDVDLDGYEDVLIANGHNRDMLDTDVLKTLEPVRPDMTREERLKWASRFPSMTRRNLAFRNRGDLTFEEVSDAWGFSELGISQGLALGDLDQDGDLDVVLNNFNGAASLYRNQTAAARIQVRLRGAALNTQGIGARVSLVAGSLTQTQQIQSGGRYLSSDDSIVVLSCAEGVGSMRLEVTWPNGNQTQIPNLQPNALYELHESNSPLSETQNFSTRDRGESSGETAWFEDQTPLLYGHRDETHAFDDYVVQPQLMWKLSQSGPGVSWFDLDEDGWDDLLVGGGQGGAFSIFRNLGDGQFLAAPATRLDRGQTSLLGLRSSRDGPQIIAGFSNERSPKELKPALRAIRMKDQQREEFLNDWNASAGPLAMADVDGDGDLDLFVGGRSVSGQYPTPVDSKILSNHNGVFSEDSSQDATFEKIGIVNSAVFSDLNGDGYQDLVLACEWGPIRLFANIQGRFREITEPVGMNRFRGWWQSVATGDFNGDGRMDIVAGNWGRNHFYHAVTPESLRLYWGDWNGDGVNEVLPAFYHKPSQQDVPWASMDDVLPAMPWLRSSFLSAKEFALAGVEELLASCKPPIHVNHIDTLDSMLFLSDRNGYTAVPLPVEAQFAPVFGLSASDFNGDGHEDLFLGQNCFAADGGRSRQDAGLGLILVGNSQGAFQALSPSGSGIAIFGNQRSSAVGDYDRDGRPDLVVTQHRGATRLYRNRISQPGLRVRLNGPANNPDGIGTQLALLDSNGRRGLIRELKAGSGYWSQDSNVVILPNLNNASKRIWVRWTRGKEMELDLPTSAGEILLDGLGRIQVVEPADD